MKKLIANLKADNKGGSKLSRRTNKLLMAAVISTGLSACSSDKIDKSIDEVEKNRTSNIYFVNSRGEAATFYVKNGTMVNNLFKPQFDRGNVDNNSVSDKFTYEWYERYYETKFGVQDADSLSKKAELEYDLKNNTDYWSIAWRSEGNNPKYKLSVIEKSASNQSDVFNVRVFATSDMAIRINGSESIVENTEAGKVSSVFIIESCATGLKIGDHFIDLCQGDFGQSYLIVADTNGKRVMAQE